MAAKESNFQLFSSLRFDVNLVECPANAAVSSFPSPFYMLSFHRDRMLQAAIHFQWTEAAKRISGEDGLLYVLESLQAVIDIKSATPLRVRIILNRRGDTTVETNQTPLVPLQNLFPSCFLPPHGSEGCSLSTTSGYDAPRQEQQWTVLVDPARTKPTPFTTYKTTCRDMYVDARARVGIKTMTEPKEVLIISEIGDEVMEGSLTSVFFWRGSRWVTPPVSSGGQSGTTRRWLLENNLCTEEVVCIDTLVDGEEIWISNGVKGLIWARVKL